MATVSNVTIQVEFSGDVAFSQPFSANENSESPGENLIVTLSSGNNSITPPSVSGVVITGLTIVPPAGNTNIITLKGVNGDSGIPLHLTNPFYLSLGSGFSSLVLSAAGSIVGVRLIWS